MAGLTFAWRRDTGLPVPSCGEVLIGKSTQIHAGDVLVLTSNGATYGGSTAALVARPLLSSDTITTSAGLIGVALFDIQTDSSAKLTNVTSPVTVDSRGKVDTKMIYTNVFPTDPVTGYLRITIALFDRLNVFAGLTAANNVANFYDVSRACGITASAATFPANYTLNLAAAAANAPLMVVGVDSEHPQFNSANGGGRLFVQCLPTFWSQSGAGTFTS